MNKTTNEKPIIFSGPMVRAILDGRKTMTRRVSKLQPEIVDNRPRYLPNEWGFWHDKLYPTGLIVKCPYGSPGGRLWVRETIDNRPTSGNFYYRADHTGVGEKVFSLCLKNNLHLKKTISPIHMPRWASRITIEITDIRVERLQEIHYEDIVDEGFGYCNGSIRVSIKEFSAG